ncbi:unnamed protein product [Camellia sinensis]
MRRTIHIVNLDPAAENFNYPVAMDIRELISLDDVMEEFGLGPNGGLLYCMEHLEENLDEWLTEELDNFSDDDYLVFDCPGEAVKHHIKDSLNTHTHDVAWNLCLASFYLITTHKLALSLSLSFIF